MGRSFRGEGERRKEEGSAHVGVDVEPADDLVEGLGQVGAHKCTRLRELLDSRRGERDGGGRGGREESLPSNENQPLLRDFPSCFFCLYYLAGSPAQKLHSLLQYHGGNGRPVPLEGTVLFFWVLPFILSLLVRSHQRLACISCFRSFCSVGQPRV